MGKTKDELFSAEQNRLADLFRAVAHPARIAILEYLLQVQGCVCGDIVHAIPLSQSTVSQHLSELKKVGLIKGEVEGVRVCYCIDQKAWTEVKTMLDGFMAKAKCFC
jgi:ArsR family transcriptional regulator, arsenate/arsenite/antimonite-responsive transcriptional repressor